MKHRLPPFAALCAFEAVTRLSSFKDAAAELNVSPSAISHQIKRLETELGTKLMQRGRSGVELTPQGERYAATANAALERIAAATDKLREDAGECLTLQSYSTFTLRWLLQRLPSYREDSGRQPVRIVTSQDDIDLSTEPVDACVMIGNPTDPALTHTYLFTSHVFPVASPDYLARNAKITEPADLRHHPLLQVYPSAEDWAVWLASAGVTGFGAPGDARFDSYDHALSAACRGMGVALAIEPFADEDLASGQLVELFPGRRALLPRQWYFVTLAANRRLEKVETFRSWLVSQIEDDPAMFRATADEAPLPVSVP